MKPILTAALALTLTACASQPKQTGPSFQQRYTATQPICYTDEQCDAMWEAAELFIVKNSDMKIQSSSNVVIQTFNSGRSSPRISAIVTKEPHQDGKRIVYKAGCNNVFGCSVNPRDLMLRFNREIGGIK